MHANVKVLLVDDNATLVDNLTEILQDAGYRVRTASDGMRALERVAEEMPRLILLDMRMPVMSGWEFAREFRGRYGRACPNPLGMLKHILTTDRA